MFVPGKPFQSSLIFARKAGAYRSKLALLTNNRLVWKGLPGTNTLAYYGHLYITAIKVLYGCHQVDVVGHTVVGVVDGSGFCLSLKVKIFVLICS